MYRRVRRRDAPDMSGRDACAPPNLPAAFESTRFPGLVVLRSNLPCCGAGWNASDVRRRI